LRKRKMDSKDTIIARKKYHDGNYLHREKTWRLRLIAANYLDITADGNAVFPSYQDAANNKFPDVEVRDWEVGRHNPIQTSTTISAKGLTFTAPDVSWDHIPAQNPNLINIVRKEWFNHYYTKYQLQQTYMWSALDLLTSGEATLLGGVRDNDVFLDYGDAVQITWDPEYRESYLKRFVFIDKQLPLSDALHYFPGLKKIYPNSRDSEGERPVTITCYYSKDTVAVLYKNEFIEVPKKNPYDRIPASRVGLMQQPGLKYPTGMVENQMGTYRLAVILQRYFRDVTMRGGAPIGVANGNVDEASLDAIRSGLECEIVRIEGAGDFNWKKGAEVTETSMKLYQLNEQLSNAESGVNAFQQNRTDVKVDFATQLSYLAAQSGIQSKHTAQQLELLIKDSIGLMMDIGAKYAPSIKLRVGDTVIDFDEVNPIKSLLGNDGEMVLKPNSTVFKSSAQKLQEAALFGNVISMAGNMPLGVQVPFVKLATSAFEIENPEVWEEAMIKQQEQAAAQAQAQQAQSATAAAGQQVQAPVAPPADPSAPVG
jgi:hypothetical protein